MSVSIKLCGIRGDAAARACAEASAEYIGLNFVTGRRRAIEPGIGARIGELAAGCARVGVFLDQDIEEIRQVAAQAGLTHIQLHGSESPELCQKLGLPVIKAFAIDAAFDPAVLADYTPHVAAFLFDAARPGSGDVFDWNVIAGLPRSKPFFVAGGLTADNVADAIRAVRPDGVDTASGIEGDDRLPDPDRIRAFCAAVRGAI